MLRGIFSGSVWKRIPILKAISSPISVLQTQFQKADEEPLNPYQVKMMHALNEKAIKDGNGRPDRAYVIRNGTIEVAKTTPQSTIDVGPVFPD